MGAVMPKVKGKADGNQAKLIAKMFVTGDIKAAKSRANGPKPLIKRQMPNF